MPEGYESLAKIIVGQQISRQAASSIWQRLEARGWTNANAFATTDLTDLQKAGLSMQKARYLANAANAHLDGQLDFAELKTLSGEAVRDKLTSLKGIGNWTADNYRLFALKDMDAWPGGDLALQEAMRRLYDLQSRPTNSEMNELAEHWHPWRGAGALFLWHLYAIEVRHATPSDV